MNNKNRVDSYIPQAIEALENSKILNNNEINKSYRSQISSFGAAVAIGSFKQAVAFFSQDAKNGNDKINRSKLIVAIDYIVRTKNNNNSPVKTRTASDICNEILKLSSEQISTYESKYLDAAVALKVAMNLYKLV